MSQEEVILEGSVDGGEIRVLSSSSRATTAVASSSSSTAPGSSAARVSAARSSEPVAGPSRPDTSIPVGAPVVHVAPIRRRPHGLLMPEEISNPDNETFMDIYDWGEVRRLQDWVERTRWTRGYRSFMVGAAPISERFASLLLQLFGRQWEAKLQGPQGDLLLFKLRSYILGYSRLTTYQRSQFRRLWPAWTNSERVQQLKKLAEMGGYLELE